MATKTKYHRLCDLNNGLFSYGSGRWKSKMMEPAVLFLLRPLSLACRWLSSFRVPTSTFSLNMYIPGISSSSHKDSSHIGLRPTLRTSVQFSSVQSLSRVRLFATPSIAACQASLSITNSQSSLKLTSIKSVMPSSHLILCCPLLLLPPVPPSSRVFSSESTLRMRWPKYWSFSFSIIPSKKHPGLISLPLTYLTYKYMNAKY